MSGQTLLKDYVKANWYIYSFAIIFMILSNVIQSTFPKVLGSFTDELQKGGITSQGIIRYSLWLALIGLSYGVLFGIGQYSVARLGRKFEFFARQKLFRHFTEMSESFFSKSGIGKMLSHVMNDVTAVRESISNGVNQTTNATALILSTIAMLLLSSIPLYVIIVSILPLLSIPFFVVYFGPKIKSRSMRVQEALASMTESAEEQFGGIRLTKTFAAEEIAQRRFGETVEQIRISQLKLVRISSLFQSIIPFMGAVALIISIVFGGYTAIQHRISLGDFVALTLYVRMMVGPLQQIGNVINMMQRSRASMERINRLLGQTPDIEEMEHAAPLTKEASGLEIRNLSFSYPNTSYTALKHIYLSVPPGKTLGIVGKTGSGKTTLVKLLLRIYDPPEGSIWIGDQDIRTVTLASLRRHIGYVPQDGFLFSTTIQDNIAFFKRSSPFTKVEQAAKEAQIYHNIMNFPSQFETKLGERGITLSGGQRQRTSLARGLIKNAPILVLDDSVSAVDAVTETRIIESLRLARQNMTTIIIAHRISAVKHADEIIVLDEGQIVQRGSHQELLREDGIYSALYAIQEEGTNHA